MNKIKINDLSPGEAALSSEEVAKYRRILELGEQFPPVEIYTIEDWPVVRNGNTRVRAHIEYCLANGVAIEFINCTPSIADAPSPVALNGLRNFSRYYGQGIDAFMRLPVCKNEDYEATQASVMRQIMT